MSKLDLLLVNPSNREQMYGNLGCSLSAIEPPLWAGLIAGFIREQGGSVKIIDADAEGWNLEYTVEKIVKYDPLLVGIGVLGANPSASSTPKMSAVSKILTILKRESPYIKTVLYGIHPSALPERTLREEKVDFICRGESFYTISKLIEVLKLDKKVENYNIKGLWCIKNDTVVSNGWGELVRDLDELPFVAWDLLPMDKYRAHNWHCFGQLNQRQPYVVIHTSLGCPFHCTYCNIHVLYNGKSGIRFRSPKKVAEEIDFLVKNYKVRNIKILDELFVLKESRVIEFCDLVISRDYDLNMWAYARVDTVNKEILIKMKQAGINWLAYGIESGSQKIRNGVAKGRFSQDVIRKAIRLTHETGIYIIGNFIFGLPEDDSQTMQETLNLAKELQCEYVNFHVAMAYPGSRLYEEAFDKGIRLPQDWSGYAQFSEETLPLPTKYLLPQEVLSFRDNAFQEYYRSPKYLEMIKDKFGVETVRNINQMLKYKILRKLLKEEVKNGY